MKKLLKLIIEIIVVLMPFIFVWIHCGTDMISYIDDEAPNYMANRDFVRSHHDEYYGIVTLGDSTANSAYMPEMLSPDTINLSLGGSTPAENYYILKEWLENNKAPHDLFMSFGTDQLHDDATFWYRSMYAHRLTPSESWDILRCGLADGTPTIDIDTWFDDYVAYITCFPSKYITAMMNGGFDSRRDENTQAYEDWRARSGRYVAVNTIEIGGMSYIDNDSFYVSDMEDHYYCGILDLCREYGITPHIILLPTNLAQRYSEDFDRQFESYYDDLMTRYPGLTVERWGIYENFYMQDSVHLNSRGAFRFSNELREAYPDVFTVTGLTEIQSASLDRYLAEETDYEMLHKLAFFGNYSFILYDTTDYVKNWEVIPIEGPVTGDMSIRLDIKNNDSQEIVATHYYKHYEDGYVCTD